MSSRIKPNQAATSARTIEAKQPEPEPPPCLEDGISNRLTVLLNRLASVMNESSAVDYRAHGLSIPAARALIALYEGGGRLTVGRLASKTSIDFSTMSHILRRLEAQSILSRERAEDDNRIVHAVLTDHGQTVAAMCREASLRHEEVLLQDIAEDDAMFLKDMLVRVYANAKRGFTA
jgi:DNA-binding MarR family transcriptional regulator